MKQLSFLKCSFFTLFYSSILFSAPNPRDLSLQINSFTGIDYLFDGKIEGPIPFGFQMILGINAHRMGMFMNFPAKESFGIDNPSYLIDYYYSPLSNKHAEIGIGISTGYIKIYESDNSDLPALQRQSGFEGIVLGPSIESSIGYHLFRFTIGARYFYPFSNVIQIGAGIGFHFTL